MTPTQSTASAQNTSSDRAARPDWVNVPPRSETLYFAAGYGKGANRAESTKRATADARETISRWMATKVRSAQVLHSDNSGDSFISISRQLSDSTLTGVKQEAIWVDDDNGVWVLLSIPRESYR